MPKGEPQMYEIKNSPVTFCGVFILIGALALTPLHTGYGQRRGDPQPPGQEKKQAEDAAGEEDAAQQQGRSAEHRADPCSEEHPPGHAYGLRRRCAPQGSSAGIAKGDFNGDGFADLAVGVPFEGVGTIGVAGAVNVIYGSAAGLSATAGPGNQFWTQDSQGVLDVAEGGDQFGIALASGDFNGDGFSDLAVGVPGEDLTVRTHLGTTTVVDAGAVNVIYGSAAGLTAAGNQFWHQNSADILDSAEKSDFFGSSLAWGDFNADGFGDLVVGTPREDVGTLTDAGAVNVIYGSASGLTATGNQLFTQNTTDAAGAILEQAEANERFGAVLTAGDFNNNGATDLAIGVPFESVDAEGEGGVHVIYGTGRGLSSSGNQFFENSLAGDQNYAVFGNALAAGDFNRDGFADLAAAAPFQDVGGVVDAGVVQVLYGAGAGLNPAGSQVFTQDDVFVPFPQGVEFDDQFGTALAAGDFNGDGFKDLAIGTPFEDGGFENEVPDTGIVNFLYGSGGGLSGLINTYFVYFVGGPGVDGSDRFGDTLSAWNFGNGPEADLAVGIPKWNTDTALDAGAVAVFYGSASWSTSAVISQVWTQDSPGILDQAEAGDRFGLTLY